MGDDDSKTSEEENVVEVNVLAPEELFVVEVSMNGQNARALIDSGSTKTLLSGKFANNFRQVTANGPGNIAGLGGDKLKISGVSKESISINNLSFEIDCCILAQKHLKYDVVLGVDFLRRHKFMVDMQKRLVSVRRMGATINMFFSPQGKLRKTMVEKVPVYCSSASEAKDELNRVPVNFESIDGEQQLLYFEAQGENVQALNGVMTPNGDNFVLVEKS